MKKFLVLPIAEDDFNPEKNELSLTLFLKLKEVDGKLEISIPEDFNESFENGKQLTPLGFENFIDKDVPLFNYLNSMSSNVLTLEHPLATNGSLTTMSFEGIPEIIAYATSVEDNYYLAVVKAVFSLNDYNLQWNIFSMYRLNGFESNSFILDEDILDPEFEKNTEDKELLKIARKLYFSSFDKEVVKQITSFAELYLLFNKNISFS